MQKLKKAVEEMKELAKGYHGPSLSSQGMETAIGAGSSMMAMSRTKQLQKRLLEGWHPSVKKED